MKFLIVVDMQNDFIDGALGTPEAQAIVPEVAARIEQAKRDGEFIILTKDTHFEDEYPHTMEGQKLPVPHCIKGTHGWNLHEDIEDAVHSYDKCEILCKQTFGLNSLPEAMMNIVADHETDEDYEANEDQITVIGLCTDICVISNVMLLKANFWEVPIIVEKNCCAGVTPESHENALKAMAMCHIDIV